MRAKATLWQQALRAFLPLEGVAMMKGTALLLRGVMIAQFIGLATIPLLTRWFSVEAFAQLQTYLAITNVALVGASLRYEFAILTARNRAEVSSLVQLCLLIVLLVAVLFGSIAAVIKSLPSLIDTSNWGFGGLLLALGIAAGGVYQVLGYVVTRLALYRDGGNVKIIMAGANCGTSLLIGKINPLSIGIILGDLVGKFVAGFWLLFIAARHGFRVSPISPRRLIAVARRYGNLAAISTSSSLVGAASGAVAPLMFLTIFGTEIAGQLGLVERTLTLAINVATISMAQVYTNRMAEQFRSRDFDGALCLFRRTLKLLALTMLLPTVILILAAPTAFQVAFGEKWEIAGQFAQVMAIWYYINIIQGVFNYALFTLHKQKLQIFWEIFRIVALFFGWTIISQYNIDAATALKIHYGILSFFSIAFLFVVHRALKAGASAPISHT